MEEHPEAAADRQAGRQREKLMGFAVQQPYTNTEREEYATNCRALGEVGEFVKIIIVELKRAREVN